MLNSLPLFWAITFLKAEAVVALPLKAVETSSFNFAWETDCGQLYVANSAWKATGHALGVVPLSFYGRW